MRKEIKVENMNTKLDIKIEQTLMRRISSEKTNNKNLTSILEKINLLKNMNNGDCDALMELSYMYGMHTKEELEDYYKIKEEYGE
jgi:hypothetical protein